MGRHYRKSPIMEAVCEFALPSDNAWDLATPGMIYAQLKDEFSIKEKHLVQQIEMAPALLNAPPQSLNVSEKLFLYNTDRTMLVQMGQSRLSVSCVKPYPSWERFKPAIQRAFDALVTITQPPALQRIGLRYINRIELPGPHIELEEYLAFRPYFGEAFENDEFINYVVGSLFSYQGNRDACRLLSQPAEGITDEMMPILLDLDYFLLTPLTVTPGEAMDWVENAHTQVVLLFEGCLTDRLREVLEEV